MLLALSVMGGGLPILVGAQTTGGSSGGTTGGMCVSATAQSTANACPSGSPPPQSRAGASQGKAPESHLQQATKHEETKHEAQTGPSVQIDVRETALQQHVEARALDLLQQEITTTERIVGRMRAGDPRGADYLLRLAETYFELQTYWNNHARSMDQPIFDAQAANQADRVADLQRQQHEAETHLTEARQSAIRTYARLVQDYPDYARMDEVLFSLAYALEEMHNSDQALQVYMRLIKGYPQSHFIPHAWLSFAEHYFNDGDMSAARQFYAKVLEYPPETPNPVYGYALYKQAWVMYNLEDFRGALTQFVNVLEFVQEHPDARDATNLARQSRHELVLPYSRVGRPNQALQFFRRYATDDAQAYEMLESLAELYYDTGQWPETIQVYHTLMSEQPNSDRLCYWQSRVSNAIISSRPKPDQVTEVQRLVDVMDAFAQASHPAESQTECRQATATVLVELATAWHREAIGTDEQPGTNDRNTMNLAGQLYRLLTERFPDMEQLQFPDIDRRDWPTLYRVQYFYAELLWRMENWGECGPAFDRVVELNPQGEFTSDAAYAAVLCYNSLYQQQYSATERDTRAGSTTGRTESASSSGGRGGRGGRRGGRRGAQTEEAAPAGPPAARELTATEQGMLGAFTRFVCYVADSDELPTVKYRRARIYYESNHYEEAAVLFRDIAFNHPTSELGEFAANLYLDSLNTIYTRDQNSACVNEISENIEPLAQLYCNTQEAHDTHADLCEVLDNLRCGVLRLRAESLQHDHQYRDAAQLYVSIAREHAECGQRDQMLWNAAINYESARLLGRAIQVRQALINNFGTSELARRAIYLVGANYHALAIYSSAADWYERFAREYAGEDGSSCTEAERTAGTCAIAYVALENAVFFRLGLGQEDQAIADAELYERNYRRTRARETSQVIFSLGSIYERRQDWLHVFTHYHDFLHDYGRSALPHEVIRANVQMGRAKYESNDAEHAEPFFRAAVSAWNHGAADAIAHAEGSDSDRALWLARAKEATSEAYFYLGEYRYQDFRAVHFPRFTSSHATASAVLHWQQTELFPWLQHKFEALHTAEEAYNLIAPLEIPQWEIASAARIGEMYRIIVDDVRSAPVPDEFANDDELYGIYTDILERVLNGSSPGDDGRWDTADDIACTETSTEETCLHSPIRQARERFEFCLTLATRVRWFNEYSAQCEVELNQLDAARYPLAAELRGTATYIQDQTAPLTAIELTHDEDAESDSGDSAVTSAEAPTTTTGGGQ
ncbi:MAG: tetratricopeptide repeat protein [Sandaracinus sp.]